MPGTFTFNPQAVSGWECGGWTEGYKPQGTYSLVLLLTYSLYISLLTSSSSINNSPRLRPSNTAGYHDHFYFAIAVLLPLWSCTKPRGIGAF